MAVTTAKPHSRIERVIRAHDRRAAAVAFLVLASLWLWPVFIGHQLGQTYTFWYHIPFAASAPADELPQRAVADDVSFMAYPWMVVARAQLRDGHLPLWNPYEYGGTTLAGNMQSALFFPLTWLLLVLPLGYAWGVVAIAKLAIAGLGTYVLARELGMSPRAALLAGTVYMFSAPFLTWLQFPVAAPLAVFPWLLAATTWVFHTRTAKAGAAVALAFALMLLGGHPESAFLGVCAAGVYILGLCAADRRVRPTERLKALGLWSAALVLGLAAAAVAVIPFAEALDSSVTQHGFLHSQSLPKARALVYFFPSLFGDGQPRLYGGLLYFNEDVAAFFAVPALVLAVVGFARLWRRPEIAALAAVATVTLAAVYGVPPVDLLFEHVYPWSHITVGARPTFIVALVGAVVAAAAFDSLSRRALPARTVVLVVAGVALAAALLLGLAEARGALPAPASAKTRAVAGGLAGIAAGGVVLFAAGRLSGRLATALALGVVLASVGGLRDFNVTLPPDEAFPHEPASMRALRGEPRPFRISVVPPQNATILPPNVSGIYGVDSMEGEDFPLSERWSALQSAVLGWQAIRPEFAKATVMPSRKNIGALRLFNTRFYVGAPDAKPPLPGFRTVYREADATLFEDPSALPRAFVVPTTRPLPDAVALRMLKSERFDPRRVALVPEGSPRLAGDPRARFRPARVERVAPDHVRVHLAAGSSGWLVLANSFAPNWKASVDGREQSLVPTNYAAMGVPVDATSRTVDFWLDRTSFHRGLVLTVAALICMALMAFGSRLAGLSWAKRWSPRRSGNIE